MNLNRNTRWEQADIDVDAGLCAFYAGLVDELGSRLPDGLDASEHAIEQSMSGDWPSRLRNASVRAGWSERSEDLDVGALLSDGEVDELLGGDDALDGLLD